MKNRVSNSHRWLALLKILPLQFALLLYAVGLEAQTGYVWCKTIQGPSWNEYGIDVDCSPTGEIFVAGEYRNNAVFGGSPYISWGLSDMFTAKMDPFGNFQWVHTEGSGSTDRTFAVRYGADKHVYSAGYGLVIFPNHRVAMHAWDAITMRIRPDNTLHWGWAMNGGGALDYSEALDIAPDAHGNSYTVGIMKNDGWYGTDTIHGIGAEDAFISKFDSLGNYQWGHAWGGSLKDQANGADVDADGNVWVGGSFHGLSDFGGLPLNAGGGKDAFITKVDTAGNVLFAKQFPGAGDCEIIRLKVSDDGDCYFIGNFSGTITVGTQNLTSNDTLDIFYGKMDASGNFLWARKAGGFDMSFVQDLEVDAEENLYMGGYFFGGFSWQGDTATSQMWDDMFFAKTDSNGTLDFVEFSGDLSSRNVFGLAVDPAQNIILTGIFSDTLTLGGPTYTSTLQTIDIFVAKYATRVQQISIVDVTGSPYCSSDQFDVSFNAWGNFDSSNVFYLELSDAAGSFVLPTVIGSLAGSFGGTITGTIPLGISQGTQYRVRIRATMPAVTSPDNGQDIVLDPSTAVPVAISGDTVICNGLPVTLSVDPGLSLQTWSTGDTSATITVSVPGVIWVEATDSNGCSNRDEVTVTLCVGLVESRPGPRIQIIPNPNSGRFVLRTEGLPPGGYSLDIYDSQGRFLSNAPWNHRGGIGNISLDLQNLASGIYLAHLTGMGRVCSMRFEVR
ncbi:MAG: hypothetical protein RLZZ519_318 [Bacteroidota bacterium]|jgi:hypothetical protein